MLEEKIDDALVDFSKFFYKERAEEAIEHINAVHKNESGFIVLAQKTSGRWEERFYKKEILISLIKNNIINLDLDTYISTNSFSNPKRGRGEGNIFTMNGFFVDIDNHLETNKYLKREDEDSLIYFLKEDYFYGKLPEPTLTINSGRGLQLFWTIENLPKKALFTWKVFQGKFLKELDDFSIKNYETDKNVKDASRVLRLAGTLNSKSKTVAHVLSNNSITYRVDELGEGYFPYTPKAKKVLSKSIGNSNKVTNINYNIFRLNGDRLRDLNILYNLRGGDIQQGQRENFLFLYSYYYLLSSRNEEILFEELKELRDGFSDKFDNVTNSQIKAIIRHNVKIAKNWKDEKFKKYSNKYYIYKSTTIINMLNITNEEQKVLKTLIGEEEKKEREKVRARNNRKKVKIEKVENGETKKQRMEKMKIDIIKLKEEGYKQKDIASKLGVTARTVRNLMK